MTFTAKFLSLLLFLGLLHQIIAEETHVSTSIELLEPDKPRHLTLNCSQEYFFRLKESDFEKNSIYEVQFSFIGSVIPLIQTIYMTHLKNIGWL